MNVGEIPCQARNDSYGVLIRVAFTMAEILLSLTIIGVVAAITLPSLTGNINERTWNTQRKALHARISQAVALMPYMNGYGVGATDEETASNAAQTFISSGLSKVLKINNICDSEHFEDCGITSSYTAMAGTQKTFPQKLSDLQAAFVGERSYSNAGASAYYKNTIDTLGAAFETANGESIALFYNPNCTVNSLQEAMQNAIYFSQPFMCANFVYDLNGSKGPNTFGKDKGFITALYSTDSVVVAPIPLSQDAKNEDGETDIYEHEAAKVCRSMDDGSRVPNIEEVNTIFYNSKFLDFSWATQRFYWSSTKNRKISNDNGMISTQWHSGGDASGQKAKLRCIKR